MRAVIVSTKHYVQHTQFTVASAAVRTDTDVNAVPIQDVNTPAEIQEGAVVKAIFIEYWLLGGVSVDVSSFVFMVEKTGQGNLAPSFTEMTTLDAYQNKKNVLFVSQGLLGENNANPMPVLRTWIAIPKSKQRFGLRDQLRINIAAIGSEELQGCGFTTYKSYR